MSVTSARNQLLTNPELGQAIKDMTAKAKKQFDETGSLAGFSAEYRDAEGNGSILLSISAVANTLYEKSVGDNSFTLAYDLSIVDPIAVQNSHGTTAFIGSSDDIDGFAKRVIDTTKAARLGQGYSIDLGGIAALLSGKPSGDKTTQPTARAVDSKTQALQDQQKATDHLVSTLRYFVDGLKGISRQQEAMRTGTWTAEPAETSEDAFKNLLIHLNIQA